MVGKKENVSLGFVEGLTTNSKKILETLLLWDYSAMRANSFSISTHLNISESSAGKCLRYLKYRGIVLQSAKGSYLIVDSVKQRLMKDLGFKNSLLRHVAQINSKEEIKSNETKLQ